NTIYVASYHAPNGGYSFDSGYFSSGGVDNGVLHAPASDSVGGNGVYVYGPGGVFPTNTYNGSNYWVDVAFAASIGPDTTPPVISSRSPASGATNVSETTSITIVFSETMDSTTINSATIELRDGSNEVVPATVNASGNTATLVPLAPLASAAEYTVTVRGGAADPRVKDLSGNAL